jgi:hypothetical protein
LQPCSEHSPTLRASNPLWVLRESRPVKAEHPHGAARFENARLGPTVLSEGRRVGPTF